MRDRRHIDGCPYYDPNNEGTACTCPDEELPLKLDGRVLESLLPEFWCVRCGRPVERVERVEDPETGVEAWTLYCHGDEERFEVDAELWNFFGSGATLEILDAFVPKSRPLSLEPMETVDLSSWPGGRCARED